MTKKSKKKQEETEDEPRSSRGIVGYLIGGAIGLAVLLFLFNATRTAQSELFNELPHLTVMAEFDDLADPQVRADLARLHKELAANDVGLFVTGPLTNAILVPQPGDKAVPKPANIQDLTAEDYELSKPFFPIAGWLVPRIYSEDLRSAILRAGPKKAGRFLPGTKRKVEKILESFKGSSLTLGAYSHDLGLEDPDVRNRTNIVFGVQTANVRMFSEKKRLASAITLVEFDFKRGRLKHDALRSVVTQGAWYRYALAVLVRRATEDLQLTPETEEILRGVFEKSRMIPLVDEEGASGWIEVTTSAEGESNLEMAYFVRAILEQPEAVRFSVQRKRR